MSNQASLGDISSSEESEERSEKTQNLKLELGPFTLQVPQEWEISEFSEDMNLVNGVNYESKHYCDEGEGRIFLTLNSVKKGGGFKKEGIKHYGGPVDEEKILSPGDLLIANTDLTQDGDVVGYPFQVPEFPEDDREIVPSMDLSIMELQSEKYNKSFLQYLFRTNYIHSRLRSFSAGSTVLHLNTDLTEKMDLPVPPKPEQHRIASVLYNVDQAIQKTEEIINQTQRIKKGLALELFREGFNEYEVYSHPLIDEVPEDWDIKSFGDLIEETRNGLYKSEDDGRDKPIIKMGDMFEDIEFNRMPEDEIPVTDKEISKYGLEKGDLLFARRSLNVEGAGKCTLVGDLEEETVFESSMIRAKMKEDISSEYIAQYFNSPVGERNMSRIVTTNTASGIRGSDLKKLKIPIPGKKEQQKISELLGKKDREIETLKQEKNQLQRLKKGLMQDLLTGEVRTSESVEVLDEVREVES